MACGGAELTDALCAWLRAIAAEALMLITNAKRTRDSFTMTSRIWNTPQWSDALLDNWFNPAWGN